MDHDSVAAEIVMLRAGVNKSILIVEGPDDEKAYEHFVAAHACEIVIGWGRTNAINALALVRRRGIPGILCIVDQDFDEFMGTHPTDAEVIWTDEHDIETMMFRSSALDKLLRELGSARKIAALRNGGSDIRVLIRDASQPIGILRLYSLQHNINLRFKDLRYAYIDRRLNQTLKGMIKEVFDHSQVHNYDVSAIEQFYETWKAANHDPWLVCSGHDIAAILGKALQSVLGTQNASRVTFDEIESRLRLAYGVEDFDATRLCADIRNWEHSNAPYRCLRI